MTAGTLSSPSERVTGRCLPRPFLCGWIGRFRRLVGHPLPRSGHAEPLGANFLLLRLFGLEAAVLRLLAVLVTSVHGRCSFCKSKRSPTSAVSTFVPQGGCNGRLRVSPASPLSTLSKRASSLFVEAGEGGE